MTARDPVAAARALLEKFHADYWDPPIDLKVGGKDCLSLYAAGPPCDSGEWVASFRDAAGRDLFAAAPALLGELAAEVERLREAARAAFEHLDNWAPRSGDEQERASYLAVFNLLRPFWPHPHDPWPDHPVIEPDPAEAAQAEERARIEALAREEEASWAEAVRREAIDDAIDRWHEGAGEGKELHEYLGLTWEQYARLVATGEIPEGWEPPAGLAGEGEADG